LPVNPSARTVLHLLRHTQTQHDRIDTMADTNLGDLKADPKLLMAALTFAKKDRSDENISFFYDKGNAEGVWAKYIDPKAAKQVNLSSKVFAPMQKLAIAGDFGNSAWAGLIKLAKAEIESMWNADVKKRFEASAEYKLWEQASAPKKKADPTKAAKLLGIKDVAKLKKALDAGIEGNKGTATKLLGELANEEKLKDKADAMYKALEKAGLM
jgi:hypothetical protein